MPRGALPKEVEVGGVGTHGGSDSKLWQVQFVDVAEGNVKKTSEGKQWSIVRKGGWRIASTESDKKRYLRHMLDVVSCVSETHSLKNLFS